MKTSENFDQNPYLFIVGCARSGTTLLQRIVDAHPLIAVTAEIHWITEPFKKGDRLKLEGRITSEMVSRLLEHKRFAQLEISRGKFESLAGSGKPVPYPSFLTGFFDLYRNAKGKPLVGNKTPDYILSLSTLHALWPQAKFIHLIRDGRDVSLSILNWKKADHTAGHFATWERDPVSTTALWWKRKVQLGREAGRSLGSDLYYEIRYESLVAHPAGECAALCAFLGVTYDDRMLRFHEGHTRAKPKLSAKSALPITAGLRDWRKQMPEADIERFEAAAGDLLDELGYERVFPSLGAEARKHASLIGDLFTRDARARGRVLPERWEKV